MSGILGIYNSQDDADNHDILQHMQEAVRHRAKDGHGIWTDGSVGIGHQLFATTPEAEFERSPELDGNGYVISADVRLDNRETLISQLHLENQDKKDLTDPRLILYAYQAWGECCPSKLLGAFAFILWDPINKKLFGARDHLGVKPLYYCQQPNYFTVASEIKALLQGPKNNHQSPKQISIDLEPMRIADLLTSQLKDPVRTSFQGIFRLPAAHQFERNTDGTLRIQQYWKLDPNKTSELKSDKEYVQEFQHLFKTAVKCRLRHRVSLGSQLSGGMDSSAITATAGLLLSHSEEPLKTFSATFSKTPECDETEYIHAVLESGRFDPYFVAADNSGPLTHWQELFKILDEPALGNGYLSWLMNVEAQKQGVHIILNGYDGDTTIGHGTLYPHELAREGQWAKALEESSLFAQRFAVEGVTPLYWMRKTAFEVLTELKTHQKWGRIIWTIPQIYKPLKLKPFKLFLKFFLRPFYRSLLGRSASSTSNEQNQFTQEQHLNLDWLCPKFLEDVEPRLQSHLAQLNIPKNKPLNVRQDQWQALSSGIITFPMELLDQVSAAFQIEPRYPLMDKRLVEFCLALPSNLKLRQGWSRYILHQSMEGILPPKVQWRATKTNLSKAFHYGLNKYDQSILNEALLENTERLSDFINLPLLTQNCANGIKNPSLIQKLWPIITLSLWLKFHLSNKPAYSKK